MNNLSPSVMLGNSILENQVFFDIFNNWQPMKTSYTQSNNTGGRPEKEIENLTPSGENSKENDTNNADNRI